MNYVKILSILGISWLLPLTSVVRAQNVVFTSNATVTINPSATVILSNGANLINNSNTAGLNGNFIFKGPGELSIGGTQTTEFTDLSLQNGAVVDLVSSISISKELNLVAGILKMGTGNLSMLSNASINGSFSGSAMIAADGIGKLSLSVTGNGAYFFPIGDLTGTAEYSPVELIFNAGSYSNALVSVNLKDSKHPSNSSTSNYLTRYWTISQTGITNFDCDLKLSYLNDDVVGNEADIYGAKWNGYYWTSLNKVSLNEITGNVISFSEFTGGEQAVLSVDVPIGDQLTLDVVDNSILINSLNGFKLANLEIYNLSGQIVCAHDLSKSMHHEIKLKIRSGIYLLKISGQDKSFTRKIFLK